MAAPERKEWSPSKAKKEGNGAPACGAAKYAYTIPGSFGIIWAAILKEGKTIMVNRVQFQEVFSITFTYTFGMFKK